MNFSILRRDGTPDTDRRIAVLDAVTKASNRASAPVVASVRIAITDAVITVLADGGWLAPLPGERDQQLAGFLADIETALDRKGANLCRSS